MRGRVPAPAGHDGMGMMTTNELDLETVLEAQQPPRPPAVLFRNVSKHYQLYDNPHERLLDQIGFRRYMFWKTTPAGQKLFQALKSINLTIGQGERVGIIGRNGAGKTTLLKLITGNFEPTVGTVEVRGTVQALMQLGIGFHPEFSGYENIKSALHYNGLTGTTLQEALDEVIDFVELGDFLHQPMKTYSLGMNARTQFAAATAIRPDILIVDEVLGAGDAYFAAKSAHRMERLTSSGCTLLLVSHSTAQILQFCKRAIFIHSGGVRMDGPALEVVKHYEEYIAELTQVERRQSQEAEARSKTEMLTAAPPAEVQLDAPMPEWQQEQIAVLLDLPDEVSSGAVQDRISRWAAETGLKIRRVEVRNEFGQINNTVEAGRPCAIEVEVVAEEDGAFEFRIAILIMTLEGFGVTRQLSEPMHCELKSGETHIVRLDFDRLLLANGDFVFSAALFKVYDPDDTSTAVRYDLLSRSFSLRVIPIVRAEPAIFNHPCTWSSITGHHDRG